MMVELPVSSCAGPKLLTKFGSMTIYGNFITCKPHAVRCMTTTGCLPMADDRRGLLTPREREILSGEADVKDEYYYAVVSRVRRKIQEVKADARLLREHHADLYDELRQAVIEESEEEAHE